MTIKQIEMGNTALHRVMDGVNILADAVMVTLGPRGRNVILERPDGLPLITKDGASVARDIELVNKLENLGAQVVKEASLKAAELAGDGTTTATVLARAIIREGVKCLTMGMDPVGLKRGIDLAVSAACETLQAIAKPCTTFDDMARVGTVSANGDKGLGELIAEAFSKVGVDGVITIEETASLEDQLSIVSGMQLGKGFLSPYFINDQEQQLSILEQPRVLVCNEKLSALPPLLPLLEQLARDGQTLLVIAEDIDGAALTTLVSNNINGNLKSCAIKAPGVGDDRAALLQDIAIFTGATLVDSMTSVSLKEIKLSQLGRVKRTEISKERAVLLGSSAAPELIEHRIQEIRNRRTKANSDYERIVFQERIGRLGAGVARLKIAAATEPEFLERKARTENALRAVRAAIEEGVLPGGGVALIRTCATVKALESSDENEAAGLRIVRQALEEPLRQIAANAGAQARVIVNAVLEGKDDFGFDAATGHFGSLTALGIIDPTKVTRTALQQAASVAGLLLTTGCMISEWQEDSGRNQST